MQDKAKFFRNAAELRKWLKKNHPSAVELFVGYYKKHTKKYNYSWAETVDEALCYGWIDGIRKRIDDDRYMIRFTPRRPHSNWSEVNIKRVAELTELGFMQPAGLAAFDARDVEKSKQQAKQRKQLQQLDSEYEASFRKSKQAWTFFESQPPSYRRLSIVWIMSAKRPETRMKRLNTLIDDSKQARRVTVVSPGTRK